MSNFGEYEEKELEEISLREGHSVEKIKKLLKAGRVVLPRNVARKGEDVEIKAIGEGMSTKVNVNVGTSKDYDDTEEELKKARIAIKYGADTIMDLSTGENLDRIRRKILDEIDVPIGTVPVYQAALEGKRAGSVVEMSSDDMFNAVRKHAEDGIDFVTIHAGVNLNSLERLKRSNRILDVVSRGGSFLIAWMLYNKRENPFYEEYGYLLEISKEHNLTISLGDGMRPGCISDASDRTKFIEAIILGELVQEAREEGVQAIVEGPGHVPLDEIETSVKVIKNVTDFAPLYLLGPLVTDVAPGYDHFVSGIGGAVAGMHGADFLCMVSPSEHLALPSFKDIKKGTIVTKIAAHIADLVKNGQRERARRLDDEMAYARKRLDWKKQFELVLDGEEARRTKNSKSSRSGACSICGELCAIKVINEFLKR